MTFAFATSAHLLRRASTSFRSARTQLLRPMASLATARKSASVPLGGAYTVEVVPILEDNFSFLLTNQETKTAYAVDPAEPGPVRQYMKDAGLTLLGILTTHHHWDHAGGNEELRAEMPYLPIYALDRRVAAHTVLVEDEERFELAFGVGDGGSEKLTVRTMHTPCHTSGHCCFHVGVERQALFSGDTLFVGGVGKFFEGDGVQMQDSLDKLSTLDDETLVFCGHEYTLSNLRFAAAVDGDNEALLAKQRWAEETRAKGEPTIPSTLGEEKKYNPFMRTRNAELAAKVGKANGKPAAVMAAVRRAKDRFR